MFTRQPTAWQGHTSRAPQATGTQAVSAWCVRPHQAACSTCTHRRDSSRPVGWLLNQLPAVPTPERTPRHVRASPSKHTAGASARLAVRQQVGSRCVVRGAAATHDTPAHALFRESATGEAHKLTAGKAAGSFRCVADQAQQSCQPSQAHAQTRASCSPPPPRLTSPASNTVSQRTQQPQRCPSSGRKRDTQSGGTRSTQHGHPRITSTQSASAKQALGSGPKQTPKTGSRS
jgi:hypothetical protein